MRRLLLIAAIAVVGVPAVASAGLSALSGTWTGEMAPTGGGVKSSYTMHLKIAGNGRHGTWRTERCNGTLVYLGRTDGYTRFREKLSAGPCTGGGVDWVKRTGSKLVDSFKSKSGATFDSRGTLHRG